MINLNTREEYQNFITENVAALIYFSTPDCSVCKVLKPKVIEFINRRFPKIRIGYVDTGNLLDVAAQNSIFTVPAISFFLDGKEFFRKSRNINLIEFQKEIERLYTIYFT